ncbi:MAG: tetratricopeptide repeat protein [Planctomycetota bacterium]
MRLPLNVSVCLALLLLGSACVTTRRLDPAVRRGAVLASEDRNWPAAQELWSLCLDNANGADPEARFRLGEALQAGGQPLAAIQILRGGELPAQQIQEARLIEARAHLAAGQVRAAGSVLNEVLAVAPDHREALLLYGESLLDTPRAAKGIGLLLRALRIDPGDGSLAERVAITARDRGLPVHEAEAWKERLAAPAPPAEAWFGAAQAENLEGAQRREFLQKALDLDPQMGIAWRQMGDSLNAAGEVGPALQAWRRAVETDPGDWRACQALAQWQVDNGDCIGARPWITHGLAVVPEGEAGPLRALADGCGVEVESSAARD